MNLLRVAIVSLSSIATFLNVIANISAAGSQRRTLDQSRIQQHLAMLLQFLVYHRDSFCRLAVDVDVAAQVVNRSGDLPVVVGTPSLVCRDSTLQRAELCVYVVLIQGCRRVRGA